MVSTIEILLVGLTALGGGLFRTPNASFDPVQSSTAQGFAPQPITVEAVMEEPAPQQQPQISAAERNRIGAAQRQARRRKLFPLAFKFRETGGALQFRQFNAFRRFFPRSKFQSTAARDFAFNQLTSQQKNLLLQL